MSREGTTCYKPSEAEKKVLWGHEWTLCMAYMYDEDAYAQKKRCEAKGNIVRVQSVLHMGRRLYLVWRRKP